MKIEKNEFGSGLYGCGYYKFWSGFNVIYADKTQEGIFKISGEINGKKFEPTLQFNSFKELKQAIKGIVDG